MEYYAQDGTGILRCGSSLAWGWLGNWILEMGKLLIDVEIRVLFKFIFVVSTLAVEIALPHLLEADMLLLAACVVTMYLSDIRPI